MPLAAFEIQRSIVNTPIKKDESVDYAELSARTFSTKHRQALITENVEEELYKYIGGTCNELGCQSIKVGGSVDHVHILCMLSKKITAIKFLETIKSSSSKWIKTKGREFENFYWQNGYGSFSVNPSEIDVVIN